MLKDKFGIPVLNDEELMELIYNKKSIGNIFCLDSPDVQKYNEQANIRGIEQLNIYDTPDCTLEEFDRVYQQEWLIPDAYMNKDIEQHLLEQCTTEEEVERVLMELKLFKEKNMYVVLKLVNWLVDTFRKNNVVWGVGRGSSCASYCLYLLKIHRINSIKYKLDISEFLK
jgi:DNA polymerase III alpha subunit